MLALYVSTRELWKAGYLDRATTQRLLTYIGYTERQAILAVNRWEAETDI